MHALKETERAYLAGIIDGEGSIMVIHRHPENHPRRKWEYWIVKIGIYNCDMRLLDWLSERFPEGGVVELRNNPPRPKQRPNFAWNATARKARPILDAALPYLVLKRRQAELALEMIATHKNVGRRGHSAETIATRRAIAEEMKRLNRRGLATD